MSVQPQADRLPQGAPADAGERSERAASVLPSVLTERSGSEDRKGARSAAPLVHSEQSFTPQVSPAEEARRVRYRRRADGQEWLIRAARLEAGLPPVASPGTRAPERCEVCQEKRRIMRLCEETRLPGEGCICSHCSQYRREIADCATCEEARVRSGWIRPLRPARCAWRIVAEPGIHVGDAVDSTAHWSGTERCGSIWACPVCASVIRSARAKEIGRAVQEHQTNGGGLLFVTLTLRHHKADSLAETLDTLLQCWKKLLQGKAWGTSRQRYGIEGYIRSVEVTVGPNGWHPHAHVVFFLSRGLTEKEAQTFGDELHGRWARYVHQRMGRTPDRQHGVDVQRVDERGQVVAQYLAKLQDDHTTRWGVGAEMARSDVKNGRGDNLVPFQLLDSQAAEDELDDEARRFMWVEYVEATRGRRAITWSRGLKARFQVDEVTDEEILDDTVASVQRYAVDGRVYDQTRKAAPQVLALALEAAERGDWAKLAALMPGRMLGEHEARRLPESSPRSSPPPAVPPSLPS